MEQFVTGFWGCFFGTAGLMLAGSVLAFLRSLRRVALNAALSALAASFFVLAFLGGLPINDPDTLARFLAHVACGVSALLVYQLLSILGLLRRPESRHRVTMALLAFAAVMTFVGWFLSPLQALLLGALMACLLGLLALAFSVRNALRGDRLAWVAVSGVFFMLIALVGLYWVALDRAEVPWQVHMFSALAGTIYMAIMASMMWMRYAYLIDLNHVMACGPSHDPVTRMRSHKETGRMVGAAFKCRPSESAPLGVIVVSIANLYVLEKLYGLPAVNHALFVCAGRLRRAVPAHIEMGRLAGDGFLLLVRNARDSGRLIQFGRMIQAQLSRSVALNTGQKGGALGKQQTWWAADVGVGVLKVSQAEARVSAAVAMGRGMSRTAWSYPSRVAWYDEKSDEIVGMPVVES
ncbi:Diguanylate cyclase, GGDEF domain [Polaromonas sp. OV174]|uniref:diguanylate cyclase domain-containing protein n=1 Tax=Polaromonas sp. OV174 TaxID=1855300 RepID=UPI0008F436DC|nr:diguanylate cyclase [Polaromonas sp. OV174]SFC55811.1 Diguanylate cyclase, GGDEF domain [Polaromonas sp. OV174]